VSTMPSRTTLFL